MICLTPEDDPCQMAMMMMNGLAIVCEQPIIPSSWDAPNTLPKEFPWPLQARNPHLSHGIESTLCFVSCRKIPKLWSNVIVPSTLYHMDIEAARHYILQRLGRELPISLSYHSLQHTQDVVLASKWIGRKEGLQDEDLVILETAALYHDAGFLIETREHEELGCLIVRQQLPGFGYSAAVVDRICEMIMATRIPQSPHSHLAQILCDADLYYLGGEDFHRIGGLLFQELLQQGIVKGEQDWNRMQVRFLEGHSYFTRTAIAERSMLKQTHLEQVRAIVARDQA